MHMVSGRGSSRSLARAAGAGAGLLLLPLGLAGCGHLPGSSPSCPAGQSAYQGHCLSQTAVTYLSCTAGRGFSPDLEVSAKAGGSFKVVANAVLAAAYKHSKQEDTPVALQIVKDCLKIAESSAASSVDQEAASTAEKQASRTLTTWQAQQVASTPHIKLSRSHAPPGATVTVTGTGFWPHETVDVRVSAELIDQVADRADGSFTARITVPSDAPPADFPAGITATGESSSKHAEAPFHT
jgi:hypothetical protein